jgi:DNA-binding NtrC family response regulator
MLSPVNRGLTQLTTPTTGALPSVATRRPVSTPPQPVHDLEPKPVEALLDRPFDTLAARLGEANRRLTADLLGRATLLELVERAPIPRLERLLRRAKRLARADLPVLLRGERGSGAPLLVRLLHAASPRAEQPLVVLQARRFAPAELERELLGDWPNATDTLGRCGRLSLAHKGTLFIEGIEAVNAPCQQALLRHLDAPESARPDATPPLDIRVIASCEAPLEPLVDAGHFDRELLEQLSTVALDMPRLRDAPNEIAALAQAYLDLLARQRDAGPWKLSEPATALLRAYPWPGNLDELADRLDEAAARAPAGELHLEPTHLRPQRHPRTADAFTVSGLPTLDELERRYIETVLKRTGGKLYGNGGAAEVLGLKPSTLQSRIGRLGVERPLTKRRRSAP